MALPRLIPSKFPAGEVPDNFELTADAGATWKKGCIVHLDTDGELSRVATNPVSTICYGVASGAVTAGVPAGLGTKANFTKIDRDTQFASPAVNGSDTRVAVTAVMIGDTFGFRLTADNTHVVDISLGTACEVTKVDIGANLLWVKFHTAAIQIVSS